MDPEPTEAELRYEEKLLFNIKYTAVVVFGVLGLIEIAFVIWLIRML
jgi:hypothetical protein